MLLILRKYYNNSWINEKDKTQPTLRRRRRRFAAGNLAGKTVNEKTNSKICSATGFRLAGLFMADVYVIRRSVFLPRGGRKGQKSTLAEYLTTLGTLGRREIVRPRCRGPKSRGTSTRAKREAREGAPEQSPSRARRFLRLNLLSSRLLFGPDGNSAKCID